MFDEDGDSIADFMNLFDEGEQSRVYTPVTSAVGRQSLGAAPPRPKEEGSFVGLLNQGTTCYLNSLLQVLYMTYEFRQRLFELPSEEIGESEDLLGCNDEDLPKQINKVKCRRIPIRMRELFAQLQGLNQEAISTSGLTASFGWKNNNIGVQHDITELNRVLMDAIHRSLAGVDRGETFIPDLYNGVTVNRLVCWGCGKERDREEIFQDINLQVEGCETIRDSLDIFVSPVELSGDNSYECEHCTITEQKGKQEARMASSFRTLPHVFTISLCRFGYNWETMNRYKINSTCKFPLILDLSPYCEENVSKSLRKSTTERETESSLKPHATIECPPLVDSIIYDHSSRHVYDLTGVVVHTGSAHGGHYYAYIKDRLQESPESTENVDDCWFEFNDSTVKKISLSAIESQYGGKSSCAYMLTYVKRSEEAAPKISMPPGLQHFVESQNQRLQEKREEYERKKALIAIEVFVMKDLDCTGERPYPLMEQTVTSAPEVDEESSFDTFWSFDAEPETTTTKSVREGKVIWVNESECTLSELLLMIISACEEHVNSDEIQQYRIDTISWSQGGPVELNNDLTCVETMGMWNSSATMKEYHIVHGSRILLWKGNEANFYSNLCIDIEHYTKQYCEQHSLIIRDSATFQEMQEKLAILTRIPPEKQYICKKSSQTIIHLTPDPKSKLNRLQIDVDTLTVEENDESGKDFVSLAKEKFKRDFTKFDIFVINKTGREEEQQFCECEKEDTVQELLIRLISLFNLDYNVGQLHLYWPSEVASEVSMELREHERSLLSYSVTNGTTLVLTAEDGDVNKVRDIEIQFYENLECHSAEDFKQRGEAEAYRIVVPSSSILSEVKRQMIQLLAEEHHKRDFRLRGLNFLHEKQSIFVDEKKTLDELGMSSCVLLCLEEGRVPRVGEISVQCYQYSCDFNDTDDMQIYSPTFFFSRVHSTEDFSSAIQFIRQKEDMHVLSTDSLKEFKQQLADKYEVSSWDQIRVWCNNRLLTKDNASLKKNGVTHGNAITFQVLANSEKVTQQETIVLVYRWGSSGDLVDLGEHKFRSKTDTLDDFMSFMSSVAQTEVDDLVVAKYFYHRRCWVLIEPIIIPKNILRDAEATSDKVSKKACRKAKHQIQQMNNMRKNKYLLSHGDVFAVCSKSCLPDNWLSLLMSHEGVPRKPEKEILAYNYPTVTEGKGKTRINRVEPSLSIDIGFDDDNEISQ